MIIVLIYDCRSKEMVRIELLVDEDGEQHLFEDKLTPIAGDVMAMAAPVRVLSRGNEACREFYVMQRPKFEVFAAASLIHLNLEVCSTMIQGHVLRGTQIYDAKVVGCRDLGLLDVMQIFGRASRPVSTFYSSQTSGKNRAWKPALGFKPKSILEIQQEEQKRALAESAFLEVAESSKSLSLSNPWAGVVSNSDFSSLVDIASNQKKDQLHDFQMTELQFKQIFESLGAVELVQLPTDPEIGHCKGFGVVQFALLESAKAALSLNDTLEISGWTKVLSVTDHVASQESGPNTADFYDDKGDDLMGSSLTAIIAYIVEGNLYMAVDSMVSGPNPPYPDYEKVCWLSPTVAMCGSGSAWFYTAVKNSIHYFLQLPHHINVAQVAESVTNIIRGLVATGAFPMLDLSLCLGGSHGTDFRSSLFLIRRGLNANGDDVVDFELIPFGMMVGSGIAAMKIFQLFVPLQTIDISNPQAIKQYIINNISFAISFTPLSCGPPIHVVFIPTVDRLPATHDTHEKITGTIQYKHARRDFMV